VPPRAQQKRSLWTWPSFGDYRGEPLPISALSVELLAPGAGQLIILGAPVILRCAPLSLDKAAPLQAVQRGIERTLLDFYRILRDLLNPLRNGPSVAWAWSESVENQEVQRTLREIELIGHASLL
jgi:hypothetical protein